MKSVLAGACIGIGGLIYLSIDNPIIGALFFSFGLLTIVIQDLNLYTGKAGYARTAEDFIGLIQILLGNLYGVFITALIAWLTKMDLNRVRVIVANKEMLTIGQCLSKSIFCGVIMYLAVSGWKKTKNVFAIILPVAIFILCGFEHSIADAFYIYLSLPTITWSSILNLVIIVIGNLIGAQATGRMIDFCNKK